MAKKRQNYLPPTTVEDLLRRYAVGERTFPETDLSESDLSGVTLDDAIFEPSSWFFDSNFEGASLRGVSFRECNVKCANFRHADLTGASFERAAIEAVNCEGALLDGVPYTGATCYGITLTDDDQFPLM